MAKHNNLSDFLTDIADAIREKTGKTGYINAQTFSDEIRALNVQTGSDSTSRPTWTGHADAEGLKAIGWTDEDIAYYQANGVNWNEEDDQYHKVSDDNKALYGVLTADNISSYRDRIVYLPKIDTSAKTNMSYMFSDCYSLVSIPQLDMQKVTNMGYMFRNCYSLVAIPQLDTQKVTNMGYMFYNCRSLITIPQLDTSNVTNMDGMLQTCYSLTFVPPLNTEKVNSCNFMLQDCNSLTIIKLNVKAKLNVVWQNCYSLKYVDATTTMGTGDNRLFSQCYSLTDLYLSGMDYNLYLNNCPLISKESLLYIINNEAATAAITIKLASYAYTRLANDPDIVAALANHPNISIAQ